MYQATLRIRTVLKKKCPISSTLWAYWLKAGLLQTAQSRETNKKGIGESVIWAQQSPSSVLTEDHVWACISTSSDLSKINKEIGWFPKISSPSDCQKARPWCSLLYINDTKWALFQNNALTENIHIWKESLPKRRNIIPENISQLQWKTIPVWQH